MAKQNETPVEVVERDASVVAKATAAYYRALKHEGIKDELAKEFTVAWIKSIGYSEE